MNADGPGSERVASSFVHTELSKPKTPIIIIQLVETIHYACATETPLTCIGSPTLQGLASICEGQVQFSGRSPIDMFLLPTNEAASNILRAFRFNAAVGCIIFNG